MCADLLARLPSLDGYYALGATRYARVARHPGEIALPEDLPATCTPAQWGAVLELVELLQAEEQTDCTVTVADGAVRLSWQRGDTLAEAGVWWSGTVDWTVTTTGTGGASLARALARTGDSP